jgi:enoyl-CoA hydratase/carnithine racemase
MAGAMSAVLDGLLDLPAISVAAIGGLAVGGGAELAVSTDFRVASDAARIHFVHARLGIAPGWGGAGRLVRLVGRRVALRLLSSASPLAPGEAAEIGLVDHRCTGNAVDGALAWLDDLRTLAPEAIRAVKRQVVAASPRGEVSAAEIEAFASVWGGPAHRRALDALARHRR